jgi:hypothetical protein
MEQTFRRKLRSKLLILLALGAFGLLASPPGAQLLHAAERLDLLVGAAPSTSQAAVETGTESSTSDPAAADSTAAPGATLGEVSAWVHGVELASSAREMLAHVRFLASAPLRGRGSFTSDERVAAHFVALEFEKYGLQPAGDEGTFFQTFTRDEETSQNVVGTLPGTGANDLSREVYVIGAHIDHLGIVVPRHEKWGVEPVLHPGADDNASGVAVMLAIAKTLAERGGLRRTIFFVGFGAEEAGLAGSQHFVEHPPAPLPQIALMLNFDMMGHPVFLNQQAFAGFRKLVGLPSTRGFGMVGTGSSPDLRPITRKVTEHLNVPVYAPEDFPALRRLIVQLIDSRSDATPFERKQIPFLFFSTSEHDHYHSPEDTVDRVCGETMRLGATLGLRVILAVDAADQRPAFRAAD